jgi:RHS repeat-associated protein
MKRLTTTATDYKWGKPTSITGPNQGSEVTQYAYDTAGRLLCVARPFDSPSSCSVRYVYTYRSGGQLSSVAVRSKEPNQTATYPNQASGYVSTTAYFDGLGRHHHTAGLRVVGGTAQTTISGLAEYDPAGRVAKRYDTYTMAATADAAVPATPNNGFAMFEYLLNGSAYRDPLGRIHKVTQTDGTIRTTTYAGFTTTFYDEQNHKTVAITDSLGRTVEKDVYTGTGSYTRYAWTTYTYDGAGRVLTAQQNGNANTTITNTYDTLGRKTAMVDPDSGTWQYAYDAAGNLVVQQDPRSGQRVQFCYDGLNRVTRKLYLTDDSLTPADCANPGANDWIEYLYDLGSYGKGHLTAVNETRPSTSSTINTTIAYDARGRVLSEIKAITIGVSSKSATTMFGYDGSNADHVATTTYPGGEAVTTTYDQSGQPKTLVGSTPYVTDVQYDLFGRLTTLVHANGTKDTRDYYGLPGGSFQPYGHRLAGVKTEKTSSPTATHLNLSYASYTPRGLLATLTDVRNGSTGDGLSNGATFAYDDLGRLFTASYVYNGANYSYVYDNLGNLTAKEGITYTYGNAAKPHQVTVAGGVTLTYDANGNRQSKTGWSYGYDPDDRLNAINTSAVKFMYDYTGRRVAKVVGSSVTRYYNDLLEGTDGQLTKYYYIAGMRVAAQRINASQYALAPESAVQVAAATAGVQPAVVLLVRRDVQLGMALCVLVLGTGLMVAPWRRKRVVGIAVRHGQVIAVVVAFGFGTLPWPVLLRPLGPATAEAQTPPLLVHFHVDHLGSTQVITQSDGTRVRQIRYRAYGDVRWYSASGQSTGNCATDRYCHEFTGYDNEPISGLDYAGARFYDAALGLFLNHDPVRTYANPYCYVGGNPTNVTDPNGDCPWCAFIIAAAVLVGVTAAAASIDAYVRTGDVGAAFKAGAISLASSGVAPGTSYGLQVLDPHDFGTANARDYAIGLIPIVGSAYGSYQSFSSGNYASGAVGAATAVYAAYGAYEALAQGNTGANQGAGVGGQTARAPINNNPWAMLRGDVLDFMGGLYGTVRGIIRGVYELGAGVVTFDGGQFELGLYDLGSSLAMPRLDSHGGLNWPGTSDNSGLFPESNTQVENASIWHDAAVAESGFRAANQFGWITRAWSGPGIQPGIYGQAYRVVGTAGFGIAGAAEWAVGY